jgi:hypothetical protein
MNDPGPDPVTDAAAYQQLLIGLVGEDDPAEVQHCAVPRARPTRAGPSYATRHRPEVPAW